MPKPIYNMGLTKRYAIREYMLIQKHLGWEHNTTTVSSEQSNLACLWTLILCDSLADYLLIIFALFQPAALIHVVKNNI